MDRQLYSLLYIQGVLLVQGLFGNPDQFQNAHMQDFIIYLLLFWFISGFRMILLPVLLMVMTSCLFTSGIPRLTNNAMLWKRLGLNRAIGNERPQITSTKKKGESTVYFIKLPPQPVYYSAFNLLPTSNDQKKPTPDPFETVKILFKFLIIIYRDISLFFLLVGWEVRY